MKKIPVWSLAGAVLVASMGLAGCDVEKKEEGSLPKVDVEGGKLPKYDVDPPDVDVRTEEKTIRVPDVDINKPRDDDAGGEPEATEER